VHTAVHALKRTRAKDLLFLALSKLDDKMLECLACRDRFSGYQCLWPQKARTSGPIEGLPGPSLTLQRAFELRYSWTSTLLAKHSHHPSPHLTRCFMVRSLRPCIYRTQQLHHTYNDAGASRHLDRADLRRPFVLLGRFGLAVVSPRHSFLFRIWHNGRTHIV
jgi:hypothetical protein